jgi:hypothetical protein
VPQIAAQISQPAEPQQDNSPTQQSFAEAASIITRLPRSSGRGRVVWSHNERIRVAARLDDLYPGILDNEAENLMIEQFNQAQLCLEPERRRSPSWMQHERTMFVQAFKDIDPFALAALKKKIRDEMEPPAPQTEQPEDPQAQLLPPEASGHEGRAGKSIIRWTFTEIVSVAREIHRRNPLALYPYKEHLVGLHYEEVKAAQRVLPEDRQRPLSAMVNGLRDQLIEGMKVVRAELETQKAEEAKAKAEEEARQAALAQPVKETLNTPEVSELQSIQSVTTETPAPELPLKHIEPQRAAAAPQASPLAEQFAAAATPFFSAMWEKFADVVVPKLAEAFMPKIEEMLLEYLTNPARASCASGCIGCGYGGGRDADLGAARDGRGGRE